MGTIQELEAAMKALAPGEAVTLIYTGLERDFLVEVTAKKDE